MYRVESPTLGSVDVSNQEDSVDPDFHPRTLENSMRDLVEPEEERKSLKLLIVQCLLVTLTERKLELKNRQIFYLARVA